MEVKHLIDLLSELTPGTKCKYVRGEDICTFVKVDPTEQRLYTKTPLNEDFSFAQSFIVALADEIEENVPFNTSQLLNNKGSNRAVIDSIIAHTSEFYWLQKDRSKLTVWVPSTPHKAGELVEWKDMKALSQNKRTKNLGSSVPLQQIFFGAPGTGKSHEVKKQTGELSLDGEDKDLPNVFRTTFHPDTDYASFVGCYKPTMRKTGKKHQVDGKDVDDEEIIYEFVSQTFTDAYVYAYKNPTEPTYLVIEEINRGNCAQIFGDLFQLLDRKNGVSEYRIKADKDLAKFLNEVLGKDADGIKDGKLCLPANLNILATMNTSDQSLFPMDSAFKRRWEWKYVKIADAHKDWAIETNGENWYGFIQQINRIISNITSSADKQLGYFFCKANKDNKVTTETFVSKVLFYLWNDVFKNYGFDDPKLFKYKKIDEEGNRIGEDLDLTFPDFYDDNGEVVDDVVKQFIEHVMAWKA